MWVAISYSRGSSRPSDQTRVSCISCVRRQILYQLCHLGSLKFPKNGEVYFSRPLRGFPSCLENPMDGGAWWAAVHGVVKSWTRPSDFTFTFHFHALEKEMAAHSNILAWRIPRTGAWWAAVYGFTQRWTRLT